MLNWIANQTKRRGSRPIAARGGKQRLPRRLLALMSPAVMSPAVGESSVHWGSASALRARQLALSGNDGDSNGNGNRNRNNRSLS